MLGSDNRRNLLLLHIESRLFLICSSCLDDKKHVAYTRVLTVLMFTLLAECKEVCDSCIFDIFLCM
jgi:hypothetical protein